MSRNDIEYLEMAASSTENARISQYICHADHFDVKPTIRGSDREPTVINVPVATIMLRWFEEQRHDADFVLRIELMRITHCLRQFVAQDTFEFMSRRRARVT